MRIFVTAAVVTAVVVLLGLLLFSDDESVAERFDKAVRGDASCERLFEIRNELEPKDPAIHGMNRDLRAVGCFGSSSSRSR